MTQPNHHLNYGGLLVGGRSFLTYVLAEFKNNGLKPRSLVSLVF
jgi:hypothetical protein